MTERQALDYLMRNKSEVLAATAHEGFCAGGRGFLVCDWQSVGYFTANLTVLFPPAMRKRVQRLVRSYRPESELVVALAVPFGDRHMMAIGKRTPALPPEEAFLKWAGRPGLPPMETVRFPIPEDVAA